MPSRSPSWFTTFIFVFIVHFEIKIHRRREFIFQQIVSTHNKGVLFLTEAILIFKTVLIRSTLKSDSYNCKLSAIQLQNICKNGDFLSYLGWDQFTQAMLFETFYKHLILCYLLEKESPKGWLTRRNIILNFFFHILLIFPLFQTRFLILLCLPSFISLFP